MSDLIRGGALWNPNQPQQTYEPAIDPDNPGQWVLVQDNESYRRWELDLGDRVLLKTEHKGTERLLEDNRRALNDSAGRKWGDGDVIGSVPMPLYFSSGLADANQNRDFKWQQRWWNDPDNRKWRKREGSL